MTLAGDAAALLIPAGVFCEQRLAPHPGKPTRAREISIIFVI